MQTFQIRPVDKGLHAAIQHKIDQKTKPLGALGQLEGLALQVALIQQTTTPAIKQPQMLVFAGDHGIAEEGEVNPYPAAVTAQMVQNFLSGGAAINAFCRQHALPLKVIDAGVNSDFAAHPILINRSIAKGTQNYRYRAAMTVAQYEQAIAAGADIVQQLKAAGSNCIGLGEMGIGNTSAAALIMHRLTGIALADCVGSGTGLDQAGICRKLDILREVTNRYPSIHTPGEVLQTFGGFEIVMLTGAILQAAAAQMVILVDGFIVTAAALAACAMAPAARDYCLFAHQSAERGHQLMLQHLSARPILQLGLRLGEGTGAALAIPIVQSAVAFLNEMSSFADAAVSTRSQAEEET